MNKKKVVFILPYLYSGGAERALISLMNNINSRLFNPEIIVLKEGGALRNEIREGISYHSFGKATVFNSYFKLRSKLKELKPDIVVTTMVHSNFLLMLLKPFFPNTRFIIREAVIPSSILSKHKKKQLFIRLLYKVLYPKAYKVISPSADIVDEFKNVIGLDTKNHVVLQNQVDLEKIGKYIQNISYPYSKDNELRFVCAGRLTYQKGYDRLIEALRNFSTKYSWRLVFLGEGEELASLQDFSTKYGIRDNIEFWGNVVNPWSIIAAADCMLLPSRWEGMPNVVLESLACGTPVIASCDANGVKEIQAFSNKDAIKIANDMPNFIKLMEGVIPENKTSGSPSILSKQFQKDVVIKSFESILLE